MLDAATEQHESDDTDESRLAGCTLMTGSFSGTRAYWHVLSVSHLTSKYARREGYIAHRQAGRDSQHLCVTSRVVDGSRRRCMQRVRTRWRVASSAAWRIHIQRQPFLSLCAWQSPALRTSVPSQVRLGQDGCQVTGRSSAIIYVFPAKQTRQPDCGLQTKGVHADKTR